MAQSLSNDVRKIIIKHMESGKSPQEVAVILLISLNAVRTIWKKYEETGSYEPRLQNSGRKPKVTEEQMQAVFKKVKEQPDITLEELIEELDLPIKKSALSLRLIKAGYTFKKNTSSRSTTT
jgi:transposase